MLFLKLLRLNILYFYTLSSHLWHVLHFTPSYFKSQQFTHINILISKFVKEQYLTSKLIKKLINKLLSEEIKLKYNEKYLHNIWFLENIKENGFFIFGFIMGNMKYKSKYN